MQEELEDEFEKRTIKDEQRFIKRLHKYLPVVFKEVFGVMYEKPVADILYKKIWEVRSAYRYILTIDNRGTWYQCKDIISICKSLDYHNDKSDSLTRDQKLSIIAKMDEYSRERPMRFLDEDWFIERENIMDEL